MEEKATNGALMRLPREEERLSVFDPRWMDAASRITSMLAKSNLVRDDLRGKPADIFLILMKGYELGIQPTQALTELYVIKGKVGMSASLVVGLCVKHPDVCKYFSLVESTEKIATYETLRAGAPKAVRLSFTIEEAAKAGLVQGANWSRFRSAMLRARAATALARAIYPDLTSGLYSREELTDGNAPDLSLEAASPQAAETRDPQGEGASSPSPGRAAGVNGRSEGGRGQTPFPDLADSTPEPDQPLGIDASPPEELEEPDLVPSVRTASPPVGRFDQEEFLQRALSATDYRERLKMTKELYGALQREEVTELEAEILRRKIQEKRT